MPKHDTDNEEYIKLNEGVSLIHHMYGLSAGNHI